MAAAEPPEKRRRVEAPPAAIPDDLVFSEVLPRLPVKSLVRFKSVCRAWRAAIEGPAVVRRHLELSRSRRGSPPAMLVISREACHLDATSKSDEVSFYRLLLGEARPPGTADVEVELVLEKALPQGVTHTVAPTHCDGLVALAATTGEVFICNPATREFVALPPGTRSRRDVRGMGAPVVALGYDASRDRYVVARYFYREYHKTRDADTGELCLQFDIGHEVFTLGDGGGGGGAWKPTADPPHPIAATARPICTREAFYWCTEHQPQDALVRFDLRDRAFDVVPGPSGTSFHGAFNGVTELAGKLCCVVPSATGSDTAYDVWVANGAPRRPGWSLRCRVDLDDDVLGGEAFLPVAAVGDEVLIAVDYKKLYGYNERLGSLRLVVDMEEELVYGRRDGSTYDDGDLLEHHVVPYMESLVSIRARQHWGNVG